MCKSCLSVCCVFLTMLSVRPRKHPHAGCFSPLSRSRPPYPIASLDLNHIGSFTSHAHDFQSPDNIIMVRSTDERTLRQTNGTEPPKLKTVTVSTVETYNRNQNTVRKLTTKSVDGVIESKETIVTDITRAPLLGSQVNLRSEKLKSPSNISTPLKTQSLPRQSSNASIKSTPRTPQKTKDINKEEFTKQCLERHNEYRAKHKVQPLKLNTELSAFAQDWADHLASTQKMVHRPNNKYGENLWMMMTTDRSYKVNGGDAVDSWYQELDKYKFGTEPKNLDAGHLTQVLWSTSEYLGVGVAKSGDYTFVVCNYNPPGNYKGEYAENVPPIGGWKDKPTPSKRPGGFSSSNETAETFTKEALRIHNEYRAKHGVPALSIDPEISKFAQAWADHLAEKNQFAHRTNNPYGENIFWSSASASAKVMCDSWYGEEAGYNYDIDPFKSGGGGLRSGHFTQMVWKQSKSLGIGRAFTKSGTMIAVANYSPRGNIIGQFTANVLPPGRRR
uniref:SCP domain-containing protein n=1 Tax=Cuerna arida TaxID=1464854 RepID=A0A1B6GU91_9HEMI